MSARAMAARGPAWRGGVGQGLSYGALGLPLAFVALPLYVILPNHYASEFGIPLATLGALLLFARLLDAVADPWIGRWADRWFATSAARVLVVAAVAAVCVAVGFRALFFPAVQGPAPLLVWCAAFLALTYLGYSVLSVVHQAWGARLGGDAGQRARIVSWREGLALLGVLVASVLPSVAGLSVAALTLAATLALGIALLTRAPRPVVGVPVDAGGGVGKGGDIGKGGNIGMGRDIGMGGEAGTGRPPLLLAPLRIPAFRRLLAVYLVNGVASAVPATLVLFFIRDRLQAQAFEPLFLASYFAAGALSMPLWVRAVARFGLARAWRAGMLLAVAAFGWALRLGPGDVVAFTIVCIASGTALGADLALPGALLAGVIQRAGHGDRFEGAYFGWWNFATKLNLAVAAGIALPLLALAGYAPGARDAAALQALSIAYCLLPCLLKLAATALLQALWIRAEPEALP